jgi:hypothetical protein
MIPTSILAGRDDLVLRDWTIIDLKSLNEPNVFDRHMFGWCDQTGVFQLCSKILEETDQYCRTRSRKYFKDGPPEPKLDWQAANQLAAFLHYGWQVDLDTVRTILTQVTEFTINDDCEVLYDVIEDVEDHNAYYYVPKQKEETNAPV